MVTKKTQHALIALVKLAKEYNQGPILIGEIASKQNVPKKFLETILLELKNMGILNSKRGKGGGYFLIKDPSDINLAEIVRQFNGALALLPCVTYHYYEKCNYHVNEEKCGIRCVFKELRDITVRFLKNTSLQDVLEKEKMLSKKYLPKTKRK